MKVSKIYTVGHSDRTLDELIELLVNVGVQTLVDIRVHPQSHRFPHFADDAIRAGLENVGIVYHWAGSQLGGMRHPKEDTLHVALKEDGQRGFADYMDTPMFEKAATQLINLAVKAPTAILCAERQPEACHRILIADYLVLHGMNVVHLIDLEKSYEHQLSPHARRESAQLVYDQKISNSQKITKPFYKYQ